LKEINTKNRYLGFILNHKEEDYKFFINYDSMYLEDSYNETSLKCSTENNDLKVKIFIHKKEFINGVNVNIKDLKAKISVANLLTESIFPF
jgi:hypothetical protein